MKHLSYAGATLLALTTVTVTRPATAQTERDLDAHEHGAARLDVVLDGADLFLDLTSPAANLLGFEHAPSSDAQREAVARTRALLESGELFSPDPAAGCTLREADVEMALADGEHETEHDGEHETEHEDEHDTGGDHEEGERHGEPEHDADSEHGHEDEGETHSDIDVAYAFRCDAPARLGSIATTLFETFAGFEDVDVQVVGPGGQTLLELTPEQTTITLDAVR